MNKENGREEELWYPRFTYDGNSKSYYDDLVSKAGQLSRLGQHTEALENYLDALAGYRNLLSLTNDLVTSLVYKVAQLYMQLHDTKAADRIPESATETHVREHGLWDERTVQHISQLIKMLQGWARQNEALPPVLNLLQRQKHESYSNLPSSSSTISANFDTAEIRRHLAMAEMIASVMDETTKAGLVAIAQRCEAQPLDFPQQTLDVLVALIRTYKDARDVHHVQDALSRAAVSIRTLNDLEDEAWTIPLFSSLLSLMEVFIGYGKHEFVDGVLLAMEERAEYTLYNSPDSMIDLFLRMGMLYQREDVWEEADHYFQHAQAASANAFGRMNTWTKTIEDARRQQHYEPKLLSVRRV
jgi:tetratricopeptide (TPR) repeat protein